MDEYSTEKQADFTRQNSSTKQASTLVDKSGLNIDCEDACCNSSRFCDLSVRGYLKSRYSVEPFENEPEFAAAALRGSLNHG
uniref:Uncharacterized protein n=1 Tax=Trichuris muris TaxID=70415 RepID=A0A5S6QSF1_TRIMR